MSRTLRRSTTVEGRKLETAQRRAATEAPPPSGHLAAAREETAAPLLVVESLDEKLERAIPGAVARWSYLRPAHEGWQVRLKERVLATGSSEREAIDRAILLRGAR